MEFYEDEERTVSIVLHNWLKVEEGLCWWPDKGKSSVVWVVNCKLPDLSAGKYFPFTKILDSHGK